MKSTVICLISDKDNISKKKYGLGRVYNGRKKTYKSDNGI